MTSREARAIDRQTDTHTQVESETLSADTKLLNIDNIMVCTVAWFASCHGF